MEFTVKRLTPGRQRTACLVLGVFHKRRLSSAAARADEAADGALARILRQGDLDGKLEQTLLLHRVEGIAAERVLLVGCGAEREFDDSRYRRALGAALKVLGAGSAQDAVFALGGLEVGGRDAYWKARQAVELTEAAQYRFDELKSAAQEPGGRLRRVLLGFDSRGEVESGRRAVRDGQAVAAGVRLARDLGNLPPNICTPTYLAERARKLARGQRRMSVRVLGPAAMEKLGMGSLLAIARGSREPARLITIEYRGAGKSDKPVVLVGKGVTFDSGGISIKPAQAMDEMKFDMCGAAGVLGAMAAVRELAPPLNVVGVVPATENLPDGNAAKPGDIVKSLSGQTVEILNTDAEGRMILNDALTYSARFKPDVVIDMATLTGACVVALGSHASGLFTNDRALGDALLAAGTYSGDRAWELPLWEEYGEALKSNFADMANVGGRDAGAITAACFLWRYTREYRWAHLDIAGTAWKTGTAKGATGRPVPLIVQYLLDRGAAAGAGRRRRGRRTR